MEPQLDMRISGNNKANVEKWVNSRLQPAAPTETQITCKWSTQRHEKDSVRVHAHACVCVCLCNTWKITSPK